MKKILAFILCAALLAAPVLPASAAHVSADEAVETLAALGLFLGGDEGYELERPATRAEALVMLLRLLGRYGAAEAAGLESPFRDGGWADVYLGYAYDAGLVRGRTETFYGSEETAGALDFATMALRALGYAEGEDFTYRTSLAFADAVGLTHGEYTPDGEFLREDMALMSYTALTLRPKGAAGRLIDALYLEGAVTAEALAQTRLASAANAGRSAYTPQEIYETASSATFLVTQYETAEDLEKGEEYGRGSGFFISGDGVALLCYHEIEDCERLTVTTTDGHVYDVTGVLYHDFQWDVAVVRVSRTDRNGETVRFFPYLDLGDPAAAGIGDAVYTVSNPLGFAYDSFSEGVLANKARRVYDDAYPYLQLTAATSQGSSGCPVLNAYGEAVGVLMGGFSSGEMLNLAVPVSAVRDVDTSGAGTPLEDVAASVAEKKAAAVLTADATRVTVKAGESVEVLISSDNPGIMGVYADADDWDVVDVAWGDFITRQSCPLTIYGLKAGSANVTVKFVVGYGNEEAECVIHVRVTQ